MLAFLVVMVVVLVVAGLVLVYAAWPSRGARMPVPWLGEAMERARDAAPLIDADATPPEEERPDPL